MIRNRLEEGKSEEVVVHKLIRHYGLETKEAKAYFDRYAKDTV